MKKFLSQLLVRRLVSSLFAMAILALMTGPPGSTLTPTAGLTGSFTEPWSFFGLFRTLRGVTFFAIALVMWGIWTLWLHYGKFVKSAATKAMPSS